METPSGSGDRGTILVVDDDPNVCELVALYLAQEGFRVECIHDGAEALARARSHPPDLIILDLMLPSLDGLEVCRELRKEHQTPIIMLTARGDDVDRILGLEMGADDYVPKPFNPRELTARVKAVLRRTRASEGQQAQERETLRFPGLVIDQTGRVVHVGGREVQLTPKEFDLLWHLASHEERTFTRPQLLEYVWGFEYFGDDRTVDVHIKRLRRKIEPDGHPYRYIQTVWGVGYKFKVEEV
ncbi:MAG: DNA-binding response regulator [Firmicutes bacterium]|nr:DNA-binding response regulator [Bacillota bacterium]MBO2520756.1 DNA-binding response regulator [Bacillota bacterium]